MQDEEEPPDDDGSLGAEPRSGMSPRGPSDGIHSRREPPDDERVPVFGTWRRIYLAVLLNALLIMALIAAFSAGRW